MQRLLTILLGCLALAPAARAQGLQASGQITGIVVDASSAPVPGVRLVAVLVETRESRASETNESGIFRLSALRPGTYTLRAERDGFAPVERKPFLVSVGQTVVERIELSPAMVSERLEVSERADVLQAAATTSDVALGYDLVEETPAPNRNYLNFVFTAPGISPSNGSNTARSAAGTRSASNDSGFVSGGMRGRNNSLSIDGVDNRDETTGANRVAIGLEMVQEFRVVSTSVGAEFGGAAGGIVNVVTRSGVNDWHGDVTYYTQHERLNARNAEAAVPNTPRYRRVQPGASLNGPFRRDRTFFATAIESAWESSEEWSESPAGQLSALNQAMTRWLGAAGALRPVTRGLFPASGHDTEFSFKLNHNASPKHALSARYAFSQGRSLNDVQAVENFTDRSARGSSLLRDHSMVAGSTYVARPTLINDARLQVASRSASLTPAASGPMYEIPGLITFGQAYRMDSSRREDHYEFVDNLNWNRGRHSLTAGGSIHWVRLNSRVANRFHGIYLYPTLEEFTAGRPSAFWQAFGNPATAIRTVPAGVWIQERWQPAPGLTIEAGARYEYQALPPAIPRSSRNLAPRLGIAWRPGATTPWVFRAGAGLFFDRYPLGFLNDAIQKDGVHGLEQYLSGAEATAAFRQAGGQPLLSPFGMNGRGRYAASASFPATYSRKFTAGFERKITSDTSLSFEASSVAGFHLPRVRNIGSALAPAWQLEQTSSSRYVGGTLTLHRRMNQEVSYLVSYTAARTRDDASDFDEQPGDPRNTRQDWALSRQHQLHRVAASALVEIPLDDVEMPRLGAALFREITLAPTFSYGSGRPLNALDSSDFLQTAAYPVSARPFGLGRNPFYGPGILSFDLRIFKTIPVRRERAKLILGVEGFNLLNHTNPLRVSPFYGAAGGRLDSYRQPLEVLNARQIQLLMNFEF